MRVTEIKTYQMWGEPRNRIFVKVLTDEGIYGWGEGTVEGKEDTARTAIHEVGAYLIGKDPTAVEHHWQAMLRHGFWLEEPTRPDDLEGLAALREAGASMDLATGERLFTKWDFRPLLERRLVDVIQPDLCHAGGITECKKIAALAEAYDVQVAPHSPQGPVSTAACAHLALGIPNFHILEYVRSEPWRDRVLREPWPVERGFLAVPERPGLGVELDEDAIAASPPRPVGVPLGAWHADGSVADV